MSRKTYKLPWTNEFREATAQVLDTRRRREGEPLITESAYRHAIRLLRMEGIGRAYLIEELREASTHCHDRAVNLASKHAHYEDIEEWTANKGVYDAILLFLSGYEEIQENV